MSKIKYLPVEVINVPAMGDIFVKPAEKTGKMFSSEDIINSITYVYAEYIQPRKERLPASRDALIGAAFALGHLGGYLLGEDYRERIENIPMEAKEYLKQKADN